MEGMRKNEKKEEQRGECTENVLKGMKEIDAEESSAIERIE